MALCVRDNDATISSGARVTRRTILDDGAGALVSSDSVDSESARDANSRSTRRQRKFRQVLAHSKIRVQRGYGFGNYELPLFSSLHDERVPEFVRGSF